MPVREIGEPRYPTVEFVLDAIAGWINKYRHMYGVYEELGQCSQEDVMRIAKDLGVPVSDLRGLAAKRTWCSGCLAENVARAFCRSTGPGEGRSRHNARPAAALHPL
jgi:hypothetical protein